MVRNLISQIFQTRGTRVKERGPTGVDLLGLLLQLVQMLPTASALVVISTGVSIASIALIILLTIINGSMVTMNLRRRQFLQGRARSIRRDATWHPPEPVDLALSAGRFRGRDGGFDLAVESGEYAWYQGSQLGGTELGRIREVVANLVRGSSGRDPLEIGPEVKPVVGRLLTLIDEHQYPHHSDTLHLMAGLALCVAADNKMNLGDNREALGQIRLALSYAQITGHAGVQAWCRSAVCWILAAEGQPRRAIQVAVAAHALARDATSLRRLAGMEGHARALVGDRRGALEAFARAREDDGKTDQPGLFGAPVAKQCQNAAVGLTNLHLYRPAAAAAQEAIERYGRMSQPFSDFVLEAGAHVSLALVHARFRDIDAARAAVKPVLELPVSRRVDYVRTLLDDLQQTLIQPHCRSLEDARLLHAELEEFTRQALVPLT